MALYDQLHAVQPTDVVALNRAIALAELHGPAAGLDALRDLHLDGYHLYHATRADLYARVGRLDDAVSAYDRAIELAANDTERHFLTVRRSEVVGLR